jgi:hypothetical protein
MFKPILLSVALLAGAVVAQQVQVTAPNVLIANVDRPFAGGVGRYQQWYSPASLQGTVLQPMRLERLEFLAGTAPTSQAAQVDCEIFMAHGRTTGLTGQFDVNPDGPLVLVKPRAFVALAPGASGQVVLTLPFTTRFTWDRSRPLLLEVRVHGNNLGSTAFPYNFRGTTTAIGTTSRVYATGSVAAPFGTVQPGFGMSTRFTFRPGAVVPFGEGCPGEGNFVPLGTVPQVPAVGGPWVHQLSAAAPQRLAILVVGDDASAPFPLDLVALLGLGASNCMLRTNPLLTPATTSIGGSAGNGSAALTIPLPSSPAVQGASLFSQWVVFDPLGPSGALATTGGQLTIIAPVGG